MKVALQNDCFAIIVILYGVVGYEVDSYNQCSKSIPSSMMSLRPLGVNQTMPK